MQISCRSHVEGLSHLTKKFSTARHARLINILTNDDKSFVRMKTPKHFKYKITKNLTPLLSIADV